MNLRHSIRGVDHVNILDGPWNGNELLLFFEEATVLVRGDGTQVLERGDTVLMEPADFITDTLSSPC